MFKRLAKKREREEDDEASGMKEIKEILGMGGEDEISGESDSESDDDDDDSSDDEEEDGEEGASGEEDEDEEDGSDEDMEEDEPSAEDEEAATFDSPIPVPLNKIASAPLYPDPSNPAYQACILCPTRVLKNQVMAEAHLSSKIHKRALTRFIEHLAKGDPGTEDGRLIVQEINDKLEKDTKKLARMKEMYDAEIKNKSKDKASAAKAARLAKRALKAASAPAPPPALDAEGNPLPVTKAPKKDLRKSAQPKSKKDGDNKTEPSKTQQKKQARRELSIARKIEARKEARAARGEPEPDQDAIGPPKPVKRSKLAAKAEGGGKPVNRRGGGGGAGKAKSKGGGMTEEEAKKRTAEGRARKAAEMKPADKGWGEREKKSGGGKEGGGDSRRVKGAPKGAGETKA